MQYFLGVVTCPTIGRPFVHEHDLRWLANHGSRKLSIIHHSGDRLSWNDACLEKRKYIFFKLCQVLAKKNKGNRQLLKLRLSYLEMDRTSSFSGIWRSNQAKFCFLQWKFLMQKELVILFVKPSSNHGIQESIFDTWKKNGREKNI